MNVDRVAQARAFLRNELAGRHEKNPQYSLRAFSRSLGVSHTLVSLVLAGKRPMSRKMAERISDKLGMDPAERTAFVEHGSPRAPRATPGKPVKGGSSAHEDPSSQLATRLELDQFAMISEWYHLAILSLLEIPAARFEAKWIAARLGIGEMQASLAMDRLKRLGLVVKQGRGYRQSGHPIRFDNRTSTVATRKFHRQLMERASETLETEAPENREFSSMTFCLDPAQLPVARERIRDFRRALTAELEQAGNPERVYHLSVQLYPLSQLSKNEPRKRSPRK